MAYPDHRMGLEIEFHKIVFGWKRSDNNAWWPTAPGTVNAHLTYGRLPIPESSSLLVPANPMAADPAVPLPAFTEANINWLNVWGFRGTPDAIRYAVQTPVPNETLRGMCIVELNTSAQLTRDFSYWYWARKCAQLFQETMSNFEGKSDPAGPVPEHWIPAQQFLDTYNQKVRNSVPPPPADGITDMRPIFGLALSDRLVRLGAGTTVLPMQGVGGFVIPNVQVQNVHWETMVNVGLPMSTLDMCDVQVNYSVPLGWLAQNTGLWVSLWNGHWMTQLQADLPEVDPAVGDLGWDLSWFPSPANPTRTFRYAQYTPKRDVYRSQLYGALWKRAEVEAVALITGATPAGPVQNAYNALTALERNLIKGLVTYLLAAGSCTCVQIGTSTSKQCTPQLPKTSPSAIAALIRASGANAVTVMNAIRDASGAASTVMTNNLRNMNLLQQYPGNLPPGSPQTGYAALRNYADLPAPDNMLQGVAPANFVTMWRTSCDPPPAGGAGSNAGFTTAAPYHVEWSNSVQTGVPPVVQAGDILITFESRYGSSIFNIGFNPKVKSPLFTMSYINLLDALEHGNPNTITARDAIGAKFGFEAMNMPAPGRPATLVRNLGIH